MKKKIGLVLKLWLPVVFWCWLIFYFSSIPNLKTSANPFWDEIFRSLAHFVMYGLLFAFLFRALNFRIKKQNFLLALWLGLLYGLSDEIHQAFVPLRTFQIRDLLVDFSGVTLGGLIIWKLSPKAPLKLKNWAKKWGVI
ncbi:VanZ family protein [Candidatus Shapirobacteria bacterium]|nr:VanZ family protein [Candidatus Shapirobacteria bacterium]